LSSTLDFEFKRESVEPEEGASPDQNGVSSQKVVLLLHGMTGSPFEMKQYGKNLHKAGFEAYIVGGAVRDLLLNRTPKDFDVATDATPEEVRLIMIDPKMLENVLKNHPVKLFYAVTNFQNPSGITYSDSRRKEIE